MVTPFTPIPDWFPWENQGAGLAVTDLDGDGHPDLLILQIDSPPGPNQASYRVGRHLDAAGAITGGWSAWIAVPDWFPWENQGAGLAVADLDGDGRPELILFQIDSPPGPNAGYYRIGWNLDATGAVTGGWSAWVAVPDWFPWENQGGGVAVTDLDGDGHPDLLVFQVDSPAGPNQGYYKIGWHLDATGTVTGGWSPWMAVPDWFAWENQGAGLAVADLDGDGRPELIVFQIDAPAGPNAGYYQIGWHLDAQGRVTAGWSPWDPIPGWFSWENQGGSIALADLAGTGVPELGVLLIDNPPQQNQGYYATTALTTWTQRAAKGLWTLLPYDSPVLPVHAALLHTNKLFFFAGSSNNPANLAHHDFRSVVWDYTAATFTHPATPIDLFCCGHAFLAEGHLLAAGGTAQYDPFHGLRDAYLFDPATEQWTAVPFMAGGRWYPTLVTLGDGRVLAVSGQGADGNLNAIPEVYTHPGGWAALPPSGNWPLYAHLFLLQDGRVLYSGGQYNDNKGMHPSLIDFATGAATTIPGLPAPDQRNQSTSVLLPPVQDQRVMILGGGSDDSHMAPIVATANTAIVDTGAAVLQYQSAAPLQLARMHLNAVLLPDRTVLVTGGSRQEEMADQATREAELYDPATNTWTLGARARVPRLYHSIALLLPDGRVVTAGSNPMRGDEELRLEIYAPPYLFRGPRPTITSGPAALTYGQSAPLQTPQAATIQWVSMIRASSTTHSDNSEQRLVDLPFQMLGPNTLRITMPNEPNLAPPGWYLLFVTDQQRIPSAGTWVPLI